MGEVWDKAVAHLHAAGRQAAARSAHHEGLACFEAALATRCATSGEPRALEQDLDLRIDLRQSLYPLGRFADWRDHLREAERLAETLDDQPRLGTVSRPTSAITPGSPGICRGRSRPAGGPSR